MHSSLYGPCNFEVISNRADERPDGISPCLGFSVFFCLGPEQFIRSSISRKAALLRDGDAFRKIERLTASETAAQPAGQARSDPITADNLPRSGLQIRPVFRFPRPCCPRQRFALSS